MMMMMTGRCDGVARLKRLEQMLDRQFSLFGFRFGLDGLIGLVPVAGDVITSCMGLYLILEARRLGARNWTIVRMLMNWGVDFGIGAVPLVGDVFDMAWRSNSRNVKLLIGDLERRAIELREAHREGLRAA